MTTNNERMLKLKPRDLLFFRDARPMGGADTGSSLPWILPGTFHDAMSMAFMEQWPELQPEQEHEHHFKEGKDKNRDSSFRFGGLKTKGPFPYFENEIYFPVPGDLVSENEQYSLLSVEKTLGQSNLPKPLKYLVSRRGGLGKEIVKKWISEKDLKKYLKGDLSGLKPLNLSDGIAETECLTGIGLDDGTGTTEKGKFYQAEYIRFRDGVLMAAFASADNVSHSAEQKKSETHDLLHQWLKESETKSIVLGGQAGMVEVEAVSRNLTFDPTEIKETEGKYRIKMALLSPTIFSSGKTGEEDRGGWIPLWVDADTGKVKLKKEVLWDKAKEKREQWRERVKKAPEINAYLVAARVSEKLPFSGWDLQTGPKPTSMAAPAGSIYYFEAESKPDAEELAKWIHSHRVGNIYGEKGFGLAVCGTWELKK